MPPRLGLMATPWRPLIIGRPPGRGSRPQFFPLFLSYRILFIPYTFIVLVICIQILLAVDIPLPNSSSTRANINDMNYLDMERLLTRCSICFDASHDFCLKSCKDQFCRNCFQRYVAQLVRNSWGLSVLPVTCPVCQDPLDQCEWQNYVEAETVKLYNKYNRPYRPMTRACGVCCSDIVCAPAPIFEHHIRERRFEEIHSILEDLLTVDGHINFFSFNTLAKYQADVSSHMKGGKTGVAEIYTYIMRDVRDSLEHRPQSMTRNIDEMMASLSHISQLFLSLEHRPGKWKELQFQHVNMFPQAVCLTCHSSVCFSCGATPYHTGQSCTESIQQTISLGGSSDAIASLRWKLMNGKRCPNCSILINREEGCNKVDCLFCGHKFCWQCLGKFDNGGCGFYRCQLGGVTDDTATGHSKGSDDSPELGVPNMMDIQAKWQKG
ncbi:hypothetical protein BC831DRAFT_453885 [Entophlyctis helioformis]|nr:hypothetical protein BC831DRAFT_453885 [Entophlyctis helioformis]